MNCLRCKHPQKVHTIDAPMDFGGCTECNCTEFVPQPDTNNAHNQDCVGRYNKSLCDGNHKRNIE